MKWAYAVCAYSVQSLSKFGEEGWELVSVVPDNSGFFMCFFKRPVKEDGREWY